MQGNTHLHSRYRYHPHTTALTEVYSGDRHHKVREHLGLDTNHGLHHVHVYSTTYLHVYWFPPPHPTD
jgi:hypothetical protein